MTALPLDAVLTAALLFIGPCLIGALIGALLCRRRRARGVMLGALAGLLAITATLTLINLLA